MKCANSSTLYRLIQLYPKVLYTIRALTHALAYFNSCLNPYLYALLNRNFCFDLIDIIPKCFICWNQTDILRSNDTPRNTKLLTMPILSNEHIFQQQLNHDDDDDDDNESENSEHEKGKQTKLDIACQVELSRK